MLLLIFVMLILHSELLTCFLPELGWGSESLIPSWGAPLFGIKSPRRLISSLKDCIEAEDQTKEVSRRAPRIPPTQDWEHSHPPDSTSSLQVAKCWIHPDISCVYADRSLLHRNTFFPLVAMLVPHIEVPQKLPNLWAWELLCQVTPKESLSSHNMCTQWPSACWPTNFIKSP